MEKVNKYHFIGIGGIGMSALARILLDKNITVSGSDISSGEAIDQLVKQGAAIHKGHSEAHVSAGDTIVFNSQIQKNNPEYLAALKLKCPMLHRSELLAHLMGGQQMLAVTGTHGKTTTSSLLTTVLIEAGLDPTFAVGGFISGLNGKWGKGNLCVAEADESDGTFLNYLPEGAILTNVEADHLDFYQNTEALKQAFQAFFDKVKNERWLFYCGDDPLLRQIAKNRGCSYGFEPHNALRIEHYRQSGWISQFDLNVEGKLYSDIKFALVGEHNAHNAAAVFGLCLRLGVDAMVIRKAFEHFPGVGRRAEKRGEKGGVLFLDDYGHHPTEVKATLRAVKNAVQERRLVVFFQPHRYTRTRDFMQEFSTAFEWADKLYVTDIYSAFEQPIEGVSAQLLVEMIKKKSTVPCEYVPKERWCEELQNSLQPHDVLLTLGAGDVTHLHADLLKHFQPKKIEVGLIFGGKSCEHEISLRSCRFVAASLDRSLYAIHFFAIDKEGKWVVGSEAEHLLQTQTVISSKNALSILDEKVTSSLDVCEIFLPILHGTYGEDGTLQGFFEMLGKPYAGPDYRSAAICMDKVLTKRLAERNGVKTPKDVTLSHHHWLENKKGWLKKIREEIAFPVYVKPVHLGSSVGITCVEAGEKLEEAIDDAFRFDTQIMVEEGKVGCRELEFAVLGNSFGFSVAVPAPGEKLALGGFVDYEKKYGQSTVQTTIEPQMPPDILEKGKAAAKKAYMSIGCTGMTRVDFLLDSQGEFWLFEMNPIPGLQQFSLFPKIWKREGIAPERLFDRLIILGLERYRQQRRHYRCLS